MNSGDPVRRIDVDTELRTVIDAAQAGDQRAFERLTGSYRHELQVHCYRMLGSIEDAEDALQETLLRAWRKLDTFQARASFRAWLYGIATNACLDALRRRKSRAWPPALIGPADAQSFELAVAELPWLQPYPDRLLEVVAPTDQEPDTVVIAKETIELAFLAAIQHLPARQRAVLILRDVLDWSAQDTATALDMTPVAVNSALQRAHTTLAGRLPAGRAEWPASTDTSEHALLHKLIHAWESQDTDAIVGLLRSDARLIMPPALVWFDGRDAVESFFRGHIHAQDHPDWRLVPTAANRQPAFGLYWRQEGEAVHSAFAICVLDIDGDHIAEIDLFQEPKLFEAFDLPASL